MANSKGFENGNLSNSEEIDAISQTKIPFSVLYRKFIDSLCGQIVKNLNSWSFQYWLFYYGVIPFILLTIALLLAVVPTNSFSDFFIQNQSQVFSPSIYLNHFSHLQILHISSNLIFYLIAITILFIFEENKKRMICCSIIFFTIVPLLGSYLTLKIWESAHTIYGHNLGFSAIALAFFGYALYIGSRWLYVNAILNCFFKCSENDLVTSILKRDSSQKERSIVLRDVFFILEFFLFGLIMIYIIKFGIEAGQYTASSAGMSNGIGHFQGFILGLISPSIFSTFFENNERIFNLFFVILIIIGIWIYYNQYLTPLLFP